MPAVRGPRLAVAAIAALVVLGLLLQLTNRTARLSGSDDASPQVFSVFTPGPAQVCQGQETLFPGTAALRMTLGTFGRPGPELRTTISQGDGVLARGTLAAGWREGVVDLPVRPVEDRFARDVTICVTAADGGRLAFGGEPTPPEVAATVDGEPGTGRIAVASLLPEESSMLGSAGRIAERYGRGNASWLGGWTFAAIGLLLLAALAAGVAALRAPAAARTWRLPRAAVLCAACSIAASTTWALLTPPFHVPDEVSHVAYVQSVVEAGKLPLADASPPFSEQENRLLSSLQFFDVIGASVAKPPWTAPEERTVRVAEETPSSRRTTNAASASNNPPLYYLLQAPVYAATRGWSLLDQLLPMRLLSVLLGAVTVLFAFGFVREVLPGTPLAWPLGALMVALQPLFGFITSGVNGDAALFAAAAATFYLMARLLRRGLTMRRAVGLGVALAAGLLVKPLFLGLVPAAVLALGLAALRGRGVLGTRRARTVAAAGLVALMLPVLGYHLVGSAAFDHGYLASGVPGAAAPAPGAPPVPELDTSLRSNVGYVWQLFAPRLPFMNDRWLGVPLRNVWFNGLVGRFGWLDYGFPEWVSASALVLVGLLLAVLAVGLWRDRRAVRAQAWLLGCCVVAMGGVAAVIGYAQLQAMIDGQPAFTQARYLLPLLPLYALLTALMARAAGRRAMPVAAAALVGLALFHHISSLILTVGRYYV